MYQMVFFIKISRLDCFVLVDEFYMLLISCYVILFMNVQLIINGYCLKKIIVVGNWLFFCIIQNYYIEMILQDGCIDVEII